MRSGALMSTKNVAFYGFFFYLLSYVLLGITIINQSKAF